MRRYEIHIIAKDRFVETERHRLLTVDEVHACDGGFSSVYDRLVCGLGVGAWVLGFRAMGQGHYHDAPVRVCGRLTQKIGRLHRVQAIAARKAKDNATSDTVHAHAHKVALIETNWRNLN